jgi:heptosyltransferase-3
MKLKPKKILIIIKRSNGDVFLSIPLINTLYEHYDKPQIDILVNEDTEGIARVLPHISNIHIYSKGDKGFDKVKAELNLLKDIYRKYDLSINLTSSDRTVLYSLISSKYSISAVELNNKKSWWKKLLLNSSYSIDWNKHVVLNNCEPLKLLGIEVENIKVETQVSDISISNIKEKLISNGINNNFVVFHTSAQYDYKIYPTDLRNKLINLLSDAGISVVITGGNTPIDQNISNELPKLDNVYNFIGKTKLDELLALISLSKCYIGMDTLVMHMSASLNKPIFAIFGPSRQVMWGPWKNNKDQIIKVFQAKMACVPCGLAGCDDKHGISECLYNIPPEEIFDEIMKDLNE